MTPPVFWLGILFSTLLLVVHVSSLRCYSCQSSVPMSECESDMREFKKGNDSKFAVNCSSYGNMDHQPFCAIESYIQNGNYSVILRECSDWTFSFSTDIPPYRKFKHLNPETNTTMCTVVGQMAVCMTVCSTDLCNGPSSSTMVKPLALIVQLFLGYLCLFQPIV